EGCRGEGGGRPEGGDGDRGGSGGEADGVPGAVCAVQADGGDVREGSVDPERDGGGRRDSGVRGVREVGVECDRLVAHRPATDRGARPGGGRRPVAEEGRGAGERMVEGRGKPRTESGGARA